MWPVAAHLCPLTNLASQVGGVGQQGLSDGAQMGTGLGTLHQAKMPRDRDGKLPGQSIGIIDQADAGRRIGAIYPTRRPLMPPG